MFLMLTANLLEGPKVALSDQKSQYLQGIKFKYQDFLF